MKENVILINTLAYLYKILLYAFRTLMNLFHRTRPLKGDENGLS